MIVQKLCVDCGELVTVDYDKPGGMLSHPHVLQLGDVQDGDFVRHKTPEELESEVEDKEVNEAVCPECGVAHGRDALKTTGCHLKRE